MGAGTGLTTGRAYTIDLRELDTGNARQDEVSFVGTAHWRARMVFVDTVTGERFVNDFRTRYVVTPNGDVVVDVIDWGGCAD